ncbi:MAG: HAMP domain-containing protein [Elusimicrobia bacterium]|nr:HAMP domain-containing protein [Elusimicrobiota bacterium]
MRLLEGISDRFLSAWRRIPLARQLFLAMFCSMWAVISVYFVYDLHSTSRRFTAMEVSTMDAVFPLIQSIVESSMLHKSAGHIQALFSTSGGGGFPGHMFLLDADKRVVDTSALGTGRVPRRLQAPSFDPKRFLVMDLPMVVKPSCVPCHGSGKQVLGYVRVASFNPAKAEAITAHIRGHGLILFATLALTFFCAEAITRRMIHEPLVRVAGAMKGVAAGRFDTRIEEVPESDFRTIATGFNAMVNEIARERKEIMDLHRREVAHMERLVSLGELAAQLAHEVRNPLTGIGSALQVMQRETPEGSPRREIIGKLLGQLNRMDQTMANFLNYARMPEGVVRPFGVAEPLGRVLFLVEPRLRSQKIRLERRVPEDLPAVIGDPSQLEQVFLNLCLNSVQAMPSGGVLTLSAKKDRDDKVLLEFADTGHGIPADCLDKVFKPFFTTRDQGSGLGLPVSRQIVMSHDGEIWIESIPEKGTTVYVRLPCSSALASGAQKPAVAGAS